MSASPQQEQYEAHVGRIARGAGIASFGQGIGRLLNYFTQIALARMYGPTLLGFYVLGYTVVQVANVFAQFGMNQGWCATSLTTRPKRMWRGYVGLF